MEYIIGIFATGLLGLLTLLLGFYCIGRIAQWLLPMICPVSFPKEAFAYDGDCTFTIVIGFFSLICLTGLIVICILIGNGISVSFFDGESILLGK